MLTNNEEFLKNELLCRLSPDFMLFDRKVEEVPSWKGENGYAVSILTGNNVFGNIGIEISSDELTVHNEIDHCHFDMYSLPEDWTTDRKAKQILDNSLEWIEDTLRNKILVTRVLRNGRILYVSSENIETKKIQNIQDYCRNRKSQKKLGENDTIEFFQWSGQIDVNKSSGNIWSRIKSKLRKSG